jgi:UDP-N-acetylglucosamine 2-epimerase (non-hydrolysing)
MINSIEPILVIIGTRPEAIKMAPVIKELKKSFQVKVCNSGQHRQMIDQVFELFEIKADFDLNIMEDNQDLFDITRKVLIGVKKVLLSEKFRIVMVHGDTSTAMSASLAAFYFNLPVYHVEAGLRTNNINSPFPEELNRQIVSRIASIHFAPSESARDNLLNENVPIEKICITGNTVIDSLLSIVEKAREADYPDYLVKELPFLSDQSSDKSRIILVTGHRRENFGIGFESICNALKDIALLYPNDRVIYPVHLNPNVQNPVNRILSNLDNIHLIEPLDYLTFVKLMDISYLIISDSGGVQEEAPSLGKPVLVTRKISEREEGVIAGTVILVGADREKIFKEVQNLLENKNIYQQMSIKHNPYGDGKASTRISSFIQEVLQ